MLGTLRIESLFVNVFGQQGACLVELSFASSDVARSSWNVMTSSLHRWAMDMARRYGIAEFFAGIEPGRDPTTRLFTGEKQGPARFDEQGVHFG